MKKKLQWLMVCLIAMTFCMTSITLADSDGWRKWKADDGVVGYDRKVEGSKYLETKAETEVDVPMDVLLEVLMDINNYPKWQYDCKDAILLELVDDMHRILYYNQNIPVIAQKDRWAVIKADTVYQPGTCTTTLQSIDREYKRPDGKGLRMNKFTGTYELKMLSRNKTWVRYTAFSDPGGFAPAFVAKGTIRKVTFNGVQEWIKMAKTPHYIKAAETGIAKPIIEKYIADGSLKFQ